MYLLRQFSAHLARGQHDSIALATVFPWRMRDILPKYALVLDEGDRIGGYGTVANGTPVTVALPDSYDATWVLNAFIRTTGTLKVTVVSPTHGTSNFLLKGTSGATDGDHAGLMAWSGTVTSITLTNPNAGTTPLVEWFFFKMPDLSSPDSWRDGELALGVTSE